MAVAALVLSVLTAVVAGTWIAVTTLATQDDLDRAVGDGIAPLATTADVAREVGGIKADLARLPTRDDVADLVADAVSAGIAEVATREDLTALAGRVETFDSKANALIDCIIDLDGPRLLADAQPLAAGGADPPPPRQPTPVLPNSCQRARELAGAP